MDSLSKYKERSYLLKYCGGRWFYQVRYRIITSQLVLPDSFLRSDAVPLFAWGRSGGPLAKSGWSLAQENFQTGFTAVINGTGGDSAWGALPNNGLEEAIFHNNDTIIAQTVQYDVMGFDTANGLYDIPLGHCPRDSSLGLNFSVFARAKGKKGEVQSSTILATSDMTIQYNPAVEAVSVLFQSTIDEPFIVDFFDVLGREVVSRRIMSHTGMNEIVIPTASIPSGAYICRVEGKNDIRSKSFTIVR